VSVALPPGQIVVFGDVMTAEGDATTVNVALPDAVPEQLASCTLVTVYVVVAVGRTLRCALDEAIPDWTTPSDQVSE